MELYKERAADIFIGVPLSGYKQIFAEVGKKKKVQYFQSSDSAEKMLDFHLARTEDLADQLELLLESPKDYPLRRTIQLQSKCYLMSL